MTITKVFDMSMNIKRYTLADIYDKLVSISDIDTNRVGYDIPVGHIINIEDEYSALWSTEDIVVPYKCLGDDLKYNTIIVESEKRLFALVPIKDTAVDHYRIYEGNKEGDRITFNIVVSEDDIVNGSKLND